MNNFKFQYVKLGWMCWGCSHLILWNFVVNFPNYLGDVVRKFQSLHPLDAFLGVFLAGIQGVLVFRCADAKLARTIFQFLTTKN